MKIIERIKRTQSDPQADQPITIAFLGDSVTQGCFECFEPTPDTIDTVYHTDWAYSEIVKKMLQKLYPSVPFTIVNAGVSGSSAYGGVMRLDREVLAHSPDLVVVCFGLNDSNNGEEGIEKYANHLTEIFTRIKESGAECIFITPNLMNDHVSSHLEGDQLRKLAETLAERTKSGLFDAYIAAAKNAAERCGVTLCDCYALWQRMAASGVDVTELLANKLNHPDREMHFLFAYELVKTMLEK